MSICLIIYTYRFVFWRCGILTTINYAEIFKALADETRLKIIEMLSCGELCACDILANFEITQPTLSYHMKILTESRIVVGEKDGSWVRYHLNQEVTDNLKDFLDKITTKQDQCICYSFDKTDMCSK